MPLTFEYIESATTAAATVPLRDSVCRVPPWMVEAEPACRAAEHCCVELSPLRLLLGARLVPLPLFLLRLPVPPLRALRLDLQLVP